MNNSPKSVQEELFPAQAVPTFRQLRGYAIDPTLSLIIDTVEINDTVYEIDWEQLKPGPNGEYVEVVDYDPAIGKYYKPVNLNDPFILASDGISPSESNPQFHQQMVYAVAMLTIRNFERSLGRKILWAPRQLESALGDTEQYVQRLRLYPHALREANAYYSPHKKSILFGYFAASPVDRAQLMPGSLVFTCLSHDIIVHEMTHAILDGLNRYYNRPTNPDVLAFHEAFADIVALFQHFTFPDLLKHQIARTRGNLDKQNLLGQLAQQFGAAIGQYGSLRDALGKTDPETKEWIPAVPDPRDYLTEMEPHKRGSILVAAVFEAFLTIYKRRVADLLRIASGGTGILQEGELHPDLVNRLADEASKAAKHILTMCIRAIDYCPPVDITFGDFLRAVITADSDIVDKDSYYYRLAFIDAFRRRGIYPEGIKTLSEESLRYPVEKSKTEIYDLFRERVHQGDFDDSMSYADIYGKDREEYKDIETRIRFLEKRVETCENYRKDYSYALDPIKNNEINEIISNINTLQSLEILGNFLKGYRDEVIYETNRENIFRISRKYITGRSDEPNDLKLMGLFKRIEIKGGADSRISSVGFENLTGIVFNHLHTSGRPKEFEFGGEHPVMLDDKPNFEITNLRLVSRVRPDGRKVDLVLFSLVQTIGVNFDDDGGITGLFVPEDAAEPDDNSSEVLVGSTLIFDLNTTNLKYAITKPFLLPRKPEENPRLNHRLIQKQRHYQNQVLSLHVSEENRYFYSGFRSELVEPFALLHKR